MKTWLCGAWAVAAVATGFAAALDGTIDPSFAPAAARRLKVWCLAASGPHLYLASDSIYRLTPDGTADPTFTSAVEARGLLSKFAAVRPTRDGALIVATKDTVLKLTRSGSLDPTYTATSLPPPPPVSGEMLGAFLYDCALDSLGRAVVRGVFDPVNGSTNLARILPHGGLDPNFRPPANAGVRYLVVLPDDSILVDDGHEHVIRLAAADGSRHDTFPSFFAETLTPLPDGSVAASANGKVYVYDPAGARQSAFAMDMTFDWGVDAILWSDGKLVVSGVWTTPGGRVRADIFRFNADGSRDSNWAGPDLNYVWQGVPAFERAERLVSGSDGQIYAALRSPLSVGDVPLGAVRLQIANRADATWLNTSSRSRVTTGAPLVVGFVVKGRDHRVLVRAVGKGLSPFGVTDPVADPRMSVFRGNVLVFQSADPAISGEVEAAEQATGAFPRTPSDLAAVLTLPANGYTLVITSRSGAPGTVIGEVYSLDP